jgi:hypothetical protein
MEERTDEMEMQLAVKVAVEKGQALYWQLNGSYLDLRAVSYTWENGSVRTRRVQMFYLKDQLQLDQIVELQKALGVHAPDNFWQELEPAYWNKVIDIHPRDLIKKEG